MANTSSEDQVMKAIRSFDGEFTRADVAAKLGVDVSDMQKAWKVSKQAGEFEKVREEDGTRYFALKAK